MIAALLLVTVAAAPPLELRVDGEGYLRLALEGRIVYAKSARFVARGGRLVTEQGAGLMPMIATPTGAVAFEADASGHIYSIKGADRQELGRITLALFANSVDMTRVGDLYTAKTRPKLAYPGELSAGSIAMPGKPASADIALISKDRPAIKNASKLALSAPAQVRIRSERMTLDQICKADGPETLSKKLSGIDFGPTPRNGFATKLSRQRLLAKLKLAGLDDTNMTLEAPEVISVAAEGQTIAFPDFVSVAERAVAEKFGPNLDLRVESEALGFEAPLGKVELKSEFAQQREGLIQVSVAIYVDGVRINSKSIVFTGVSAAIAVKAGDLVKVSVRSAGIAIETTGRAKKQGRVGETIEVEISLGDNSQRTVHLGVIKAPGLVEVKL